MPKTEKKLCILCCTGILFALLGCGGGQLLNSSDSGSGGSGGSGGTGGTGGSGGSGAVSTFQLTVATSGSGPGNVTSSPSGINCGLSCQATFSAGTVVNLTAVAGPNAAFIGWSGACSGTTTCSVTINANTSVSATFNTVAGITSINHVIILTQENRSFDNYLGELRQYWAENGIPDQSFDGLPQFNPTSGAAPLYGPPPSSPGCDNSGSGYCSPDPSHGVTSFHMPSVCDENTSPSWNESHNDWDYHDPVQDPASIPNGFVFTAAYDARALGYYDSNGIRAMGYYDDKDLNFLYYMATNFATSDRWFMPVMSRTNINREYLMGATSHGYAYPNGTTASDTPQINTMTIFEDLQNAGISWKIYLNTTGTGCSSSPPYNAACLMRHSYLSNFTYAQTVVSKYPQNIAPDTQYFTDLQNGTLPQVAMFDPPSDAGLDEHGTDSDADAPTNVQAGEAYIESLITALMNSSSWSSSVVFWTYDEAGGLYDHVTPQPAVSPDGIKPVDLLSGDICTNSSGPTCDFVFTGYRIPLVVVSPYAKKNYVSHTVADFTAMLKFIETRWNLPPLTKRDAAQMDMTEFFDFSNPSWMTPPTPPDQNRGGACYLGTP